jgi:hypothetical protein
MGIINDLWSFMRSPKTQPAAWCPMSTRFCCGCGKADRVEQPRRPIGTYLQRTI